MSDVLGASSAKTGGEARRDVPFKVTNPERIPPQRYYDQAFYDLECEHLWPRVWQMACRLEEIPEVGDWVEYVILDKSVFVVRTRTGIKAFHNACRHRGVKLLAGHGNCAASGITCPFHGWRWNMDGQNTFVFFPQVFSDENLQAPDLGLVPCRVELWGGSAFINFDDDAPPLIDCIKPFADLHGPRAVDKLKMDWWLSVEINANWKLAMEAFMEGYHVLAVHPQLQAVIPPELDNFRAPEAKLGSLRAYKTGKTYVDSFIVNLKVLYEGMLSMTRPIDIEVAEAIKDTVVLPDDIEQVPEAWYRQFHDALTKTARERNIPMPDLNALTPIPSVNYCFPHYFLLPTFGNMASYRIRPLGPEKCLFEMWSLSLHPEDEVSPRPVAPPTVQVGDPSIPLIPSQDFSTIPRQQLGLHNKGFEYMRLARDCEGSISKYQRLIDGFIAGVASDKLLAGMQAACSVIDSPITDVGF